MEITNTLQQKNNAQVQDTEQPKVKYTTHGPERTIELTQTQISANGTITRIKIPHSGNADFAMPEIERGHPLEITRSYGNFDWRLFCSTLQVGDVFTVSNDERLYRNYYANCRRYNIKLARKKQGGVFRVQVAAKK